MGLVVEALSPVNAAPPGPGLPVALPWRRATSSQLRAAGAREQETAFFDDFLVASGAAAEESHRGVACMRADSQEGGRQINNHTPGLGIGIERLLRAVIGNYFALVGAVKTDGGRTNLPFRRAHCGHGVNRRDIQPGDQAEKHRAPIAHDIIGTYLG